MSLLVTVSCVLLQDASVFSLERNPAHRLLFHGTNSTVNADGSQTGRLCLDCFSSAIPVGCTTPRVPVPCSPRASLLSCPRNDILVGCNIALVQFQTLNWKNNNKRRRNHIWGLLKKKYDLPGKGMDLPALQCFKNSLEKQVRNGLGPSDLSLGKWDGLEDPSMPYDLENLS